MAPYYAHFATLNLQCALQSQPSNDVEGIVLKWEAEWSSLLYCLSVLKAFFSCVFCNVLYRHMIEWGIITLGQLGAVSVCVYSGQCSVIGRQPLSTTVPPLGCWLGKQNTGEWTQDRESDGTEHRAGFGTQLSNTWWHSHTDSSPMTPMLIS